MSARKTPEQIADDLATRGVDGVPRMTWPSVVIDALRAAGYVIVHPDDVEAKKFPDFDVIGLERDKQVTFARGWNMCLRAIFPEGPTP